MNVGALIKKGQKLFADNSPAILTTVGIAGTIGTAVLAGRAGYKAGYNVAMDEATGGTKEESTNDRRRRLFKATWSLYAPAAITCVGTVTAVATASRINTSRLAGLATAYTLTDRAFSEYKEKVVETIGEKKETEVRDKIMQDRVGESGDRSSLIIIDGTDTLCYDAYTDRYFQSSMEKLKSAQNAVNYEIIHNFYVSLSEFYDKVGLPKTAMSDEVGWNQDNLLELHFTSVLTPDGRTALGYTFHVAPIRGYYKSHS